MILTRAEQAAHHLGRSDTTLARLVKVFGVITLGRPHGGFSALARHILYQQVSGRSADAVVRKLKAMHGGSGFPESSWFLEQDDGVLRKAGVSRQKARYLRDLALKVKEGSIDFRKVPRLSDEEVIRELTKVLGIGVWTAQMYLIFSLGRADVLPTGDFGIRKAVQRNWELRGLPSELAVERLGRPWAPYRSFASLYLWRSLERSR